MSRFAYVKYDECSAAKQAVFKARVEHLAEQVERFDIPVPEIEAPAHQVDAFHRAHQSRHYAIKALEEFYMWTGKLIKDAQIARDSGAEPQEERKNG